MAQMKKYKDANSWCRKMCFTEAVKPLVKDFFDKLLANRFRLVLDGEQLAILLVGKEISYGCFNCLEDGVNVIFTPQDFVQSNMLEEDRRQAEELLEALKSFLRPPEYQDYKPYDDYSKTFYISYKTLIERQEEFIALLNRYRYAVGAL